MLLGMPASATTLHWLVAFAIALILNLGIAFSLHTKGIQSRIGNASTPLNIAVIALPADEPETAPARDNEPMTAEPAEPETPREAVPSKPEPIPQAQPEPLPVEPVVAPVVERIPPAKREPKKPERRTSKSTKPAPTPTRSSSPKPARQTAKSPVLPSTAARAPDPMPSPAVQQANERESLPARSAEATARYTDQLRTLIEQGKRYPRKALMRGRQGTVTVRLSINRDGSLRGIVVTTSSGHAVLDDAAIALAKKAAPFPRLPVGQSVPFEVTVPVAYRLN